MSDSDSKPRLPRSAWLRPLVLAGLIGAVILIGPSTGLGRYLDYAEFEDLVVSSGLVAPLVFIGLFTLGAVFLAPGSLISFVGSAVFGPSWAFVLIVIGANLGASAAFWVGRWGGQDLVELWLVRSPGWLRRVDAHLEANGLLAVLFLRLIFAPYNVLNYVAAVTHVGYRDYAVGTFFGLLPVIFVWVFLGDVLGDVWRYGDTSLLWSLRSGVAAAVFLGCLAVPVVLRRTGRI